ncbi:MAG: hypothetical protein DI598_08360 [Pseudopedobacter saltans]|uniref:Secretion system C-terminal sorting domain-containing protein n=1 Tax=Pseudopedobacter saltans TaxID=151895 RepID=A0A2W5F1G4_9SPHI|nr:MAG: hypothetical protein DI598_08360 [Pseudopedobacter saltans]
MRSLFVLVFTSVVLWADAQYLLEEDFDFTVDAVAGVNDWVHQSGTTNFMQTISPGLTFPNYPGSGVGKAVRVNGVGGEDVYKKFSSRTKLYYSFMLKVVPATNTVKTGYVAFLGKEQNTGVNGNVNGNYFARIGIQTQGDGTWKIGTSNWAIPSTSSTPMNPIFSSNAFLVNKVYAVIVSLDMSNNYKVAMWVKEDHFPNSEVEAGIPDVIFFNAPNTAALPTSVDVIGLRQDADCPNVVMDGIRVFDNWGSFVLPLKLISFGVQHENKNYASLKWETVSSINVDRFEIEKSMDSKLFQYISSIKCVNKSDKIQYNFKDYNTRVETIYYRLKIVDFDGKFVYSSVVVLKEDLSSTFKIGNLGGRKIRVFHSNVKAAKFIQILDFNGVLRKVVTASAGPSTEINLSELPVGNYILQIGNATSTISQKFVLQ